MTVALADFRARYPHVTIPEWLQGVEEVYEPAVWARGSTAAFVLAMHVAMGEPEWEAPPAVAAEARRLLAAWHARVMQAVDGHSASGRHRGSGGFTPGR